MSQSSPQHSDSQNSYYCPSHPSLKLLYFCANSECLQSFCSLCKSTHNHPYSFHRNRPIILSFPLIVSQTKQKISSTLNSLNRFVSCLKEQNLTERTTPLSARGTSQVKPEKPLILERLEYLQITWKDLLTKLDTEEAVDVLKITYPRDFERELEDAKDRCMREHNSNQNNPKLEEVKIRSAAETRRRRGFASIIDEINKLGFKSSQPLQEGTGDSSKTSFDEKENSSNMRFKGYVPWTLDTQNNKQEIDQKNFLNVIIDHVPLPLSKTGSPISTIKGDNSFDSPISYLNASPTQTVASTSRRPSKFALSPFSVYKTQRVEGGSENFDLKTEGGHEEETSNVDLRLSEFKVNIVPARSNN